jgi:dolichol kinase
VFCVLVASELLWRKKLLRDEKSRKLVHILVGGYVAFWPFFITWGWIQLISLGLLVGVVLSWKLSIFRAIHSVPRRTVGEFLYAIAIGICALLHPPAAIFAVAVLHLSLADGLAALVGKRVIKIGKYKIFGYTKTLAGSATFLVTSALLIVGYIGFAAVPNWHLVWLLLWLPIVLTLVENLAVAGVDNVLIPLIVVLVLQSVV